MGDCIRVYIHYNEKVAHISTRVSLAAALVGVTTVIIHPEEEE